MTDQQAPPFPEKEEDSVNNDTRQEETDNEIALLVQALTEDKEVLQISGLVEFLEAEEVNEPNSAQPSPEELTTQIKRSESALDDLATELENAPESDDLKLYHSIMLQRTGEFKNSLQELEEVVENSPDNRVARRYYAQALLNLGDWKKGLLELEVSRGELTALQKEFCADISKLWTGQDLTDKHIVVISNGRQSDQIQFSRYVNELRKMRPRKVGFVSDPEMVDLLRSLSDVNRVDSKLFEPFDYFVPVESLPLRLNADSSELPGSPYLSCHDRKVESVKSRIRGGQPLLGLCWRNHEIEGVDQAEIQYKENVNSLDLESLEWHLKELAMDYDLISFQQNLRLDEREILSRCGCRIIEETEFKDFSAIAEMMLCLDTVITVDSPIAHLAGALGVDAHVMLPYAHDWKWNVTEESCDWYPHLKIHRKDSEDCWRSTISKVLDEVKITKVMQQAS